MLQSRSGGEGEGVGAGEPGWGRRAVLIPPPRDQVTQGSSSGPHGGTVPSPTLRRGGSGHPQHGARPHLPWPNRLGYQASQGQVAFGHKTPHLWSTSLSTPPPTPSLSPPATGHLSLSRPPSLSSVPCEMPLLCFPWSLAFLRRGQGTGCSPAHASSAPPQPAPSLSPGSLWCGLLPRLCGPRSLDLYLVSAALSSVSWGRGPGGAPRRAPQEYQDTSQHAAVP